MSPCKSKEPRTLERLDEHNSVVNLKGGNIVSDLLNNTNTFTTGNSRESIIKVVLAHDLKLSSQCNSLYSIQIEDSNGRGNHLDLNILGGDVLKLSLLHPILLVSVEKIRT